MRAQAVVEVEEVEGECEKKLKRIVVVEEEEGEGNSKGGRKDPSVEMLH